MTRGPAQPRPALDTTRLNRVGALASRVGSLRPEDPNVRLGLYIGLALMVMLSVALAAWSWLADLPDLDWHLRPAWLAFAFLSLASLVLINAELWRRLLRALGPVLPARRSTAIWCVSAVARYVPTSLLMPVVRVALAEREGVPKRISGASVFYELALAFTGALVVGAYFVIDLPALSGDSERFLVLILPIVALLALHPAIFHRSANFALRILGRSPLPTGLAPWTVLRFAAFYSLASVLGGLSVYGVAQSIHPVDSGEVPIVIGAFAVGTTISILAFMLPGGLVARETGLAVALAPVMPAAPAVAVAILVRILQLAVELLLALLTPLAAGRRGPNGAAGTLDQPDGLATEASTGSPVSRQISDQREKWSFRSR